MRGGARVILAAACDRRGAETRAFKQLQEQLMDYFVAALHETGQLRRQGAPRLMLEFCYANVQYAGYSRREVREAS